MIRQTHDIQKKRILIVEDELMIAGDLQDILERSGYDVIGPAFSYDQALSYLENEAPDLAILDIEIKGPCSGLDIGKNINDRFNIPFIFLTSYSDTATIQKVIDLNPSGYLIKPFKENDIAPTIALAFANANIMAKTIFPTIEQINTTLEKPLSDQEHRILEMLWQGKKTKDIAKDLFLSINTIKTYLNRIFTKLNVNSRTQAINRALDR